MRRALITVTSSLLAACGAATPGGELDGGAGAPTWYRDVLPIAQTQCTGCHVTGGIAPFALDTWASARPMAAAMADAVAQRRMPPWPAAQDCGGPFVDARVLTAEQIATFEAWARAGAPEGDPADAPPGPSVTAQALPRVDATLTMAEPYTPSANLADDYRCFLVDPALPQAKVVTGYDIVPGATAVVHHVILYVVDTQAALARDAQEAGAGWQCFGDADLPSDGALGAWAPGMSAVVYPRGTGIQLAPGQALAMQVHYNTQGGRVPDQTSVKLMFGAGTETRAYLLGLVANKFSIPPQAVDYRHEKAFPNTLGFPLKLYGFMPHMHTLGRRITMTGGADNACLVDIPRWDFHWQGQYFRKAPFLLPAGEAVTLKCSWDNPTAQTVTWGEGTADEMCFAFVYATP